VLPAEGRQDLLYLQHVLPRGDPSDRAVRHEPHSPAETLRECVRIPVDAWMSVGVCVTLWVGSGLATG
jgi:hypothetical protein